MTEGTERKQCFTSIQSRKLLGSLDFFNFCPSMDLVVFGTTASMHQQKLYRTVSWQKVATITNEMEEAVHTVTCWSPSGRWIAVARDKTVSLYGVEPLANPAGGATFSSDATEAQHSWTVDHPVKSLHWAHVGRAHPTVWKIREEEREAELSWNYQSHYIDSTQFFLPPSGYLHPSDEDDHHPSDEDDHHRHHEQTTTTALPESKTPLSVLCVTTTMHVELYLHGRYRLLTLDRPGKDASSPSHVAFSNDLSYFITQADPSSLSLYHFPFLKRDRYPFQIISSLHASITSHLETLRTATVECANSWKSSLKPLDTKLQPLLRLLQNYGVDDQPLGVILKQYILFGHTSESSSVANAMDQFFTSVQMNDQLLQRMERSLHGALANVESQARKGLLSPTQALCYEIQELAGHVEFHHRQQSKELQELITSGHQLWISVHALIVSIIQGRLQIRDFCGWLRSAGSQIKARGTAANSVQRENAKKRRVPQAVLERLLSSMNINPLDPTASLSEHLLNITTSTLLKDSAERLPLSPKSSRNEVRPESPTSVLGLVSSTPTVPRAVKLTGDAFSSVMVNPLQNMPEDLLPLNIHLSSSSCTLMALHMRIGRDSFTSDYDDDDDVDESDAQTTNTYFFPKACWDKNHPDDANMMYCRQWSLVATVHENIVQLFAIPLGWRDSSNANPENNDDEDDEENNNIPFYLSAKLVLPVGGTIRDVDFYGDDGKSSLSSGNDSGTGKEGCQKLGILYQPHNDDDLTVQLWLASYDRILWQGLTFQTTLIDETQLEPFATWKMLPIAQGGDIGQDEENMVLFVQTRNVLMLEHGDDDVRLMLCGSRGVGAVSVGSGNLTTLELLDLEEDEDAEEEEEEDQEEMDENEE